MADRRDADQPLLVASILDLLTRFKREIYTALPGLVESYDAATRRATVQPALRLVLADSEESEVRQAPVMNVPVLLPSAGGYTVSLPIGPGEPVMLIVAQRDLTRWKESYAESTPGPGIMVARDAVAIAGFGPRSYTPANSGGIALQSDDGRRYIRIQSDGTIAAANESGAAFVLKSSGEIDFDAPSGVVFNGSMLIDGAIVATGDIGTSGQVTAAGVRLSTHRHLKEHVPPVPGQTGDPVPST